MLVVQLLAVRVQVITPVVAAQVALELGADVVQLVEKCHELVVEVLVQETRQTERHQIQHLRIVHEVALHLIGDAAADARQLAVAEAQRRDAGLQTVRQTGARLRDGEQQPRDIDVGQVGAVTHDVSA